jgi:hypothetical protein
MAKKNQIYIFILSMFRDIIHTVLKRRACHKNPAGKSNENVRNHRHDRTSSQPINRKTLVENQSKPG